MTGWSAAAPWAVHRGRRHEQPTAPVLALAIRLGSVMCLGIVTLPNEMTTAVRHSTLHRACECARPGQSRAMRRGRRHEQLSASVVVPRIRLGIGICLGIGALPRQMATAACRGMLRRACERACAGRAAGVAAVAADQQCVPEVAIRLGIGIWLGIVVRQEKKCCQRVGRPHAEVAVVGGIVDHSVVVERTSRPHYARVSGGGKHACLAAGSHGEFFPRRRYHD